MSYYEILLNSIHRSVTRSSHNFTPKLASSPPTIQSPLTAHPGEYLMKISVGTPPVDLLMVADTGSDLIWTQCKPCIKCYKQDSPYFDPKKSSTYKKQLRRSKACQSMHSSTYRDDKSFCKYVYSYGDGSTTAGDLSLESFTFESTSGKPVIFPMISFGCGHLNKGHFDKHMTGIVGLGNGELSFVNQLSNTINRKFSYCMVPLRSKVSSKISFGSKAVVSGSRVQTTPFFTKDPKTFYMLNLKSVSIGDTNLKFKTESYTNNATNYNDDGNIIIDSGTTVTFLPSKFYRMIEDEFKRVIPSKPVKAHHRGLNLCYNYKNVERIEEKVPTVTFHFTGADLELGVLNTMLEVDPDVICLSMLPASDEHPVIFGNLQQMNYLVGYDLDSKTVSFKKTDCTDCPDCTKY